MTTNIHVSLNPIGIQAIINQLELYKSNLTIHTQELLQRLTNDGVTIAKAKVVQLGIKYDTNLTKSINGMVVGNVGFVKVDDKHAVFFEFGTGPVGAKNKHPKGKGYASKGWYTKADGKAMDALYGWTPLGKDGDTFFYTEGQPSKPFLYQTAIELRQELPRIAREVFRS